MSWALALLIRPFLLLLLVVFFFAPARYACSKLPPGTLKRIVMFDMHTIPWWGTTLILVAIYGLLAVAVNLYGL